MVIYSFHIWSYIVYIYTLKVYGHFLWTFLSTDSRTSQLLPIRSSTILWTAINNFVRICQQNRPMDLFANIEDAILLTCCQNFCALPNLWKKIKCVQLYTICSELWTNLSIIVDKTVTSLETHRYISNLSTKISMAI